MDAKNIKKIAPEVGDVFQRKDGVRLLVTRFHTGDYWVEAPGSDSLDDNDWYDARTLMDMPLVAHIDLSKAIR